MKVAAKITEQQIMSKLGRIAIMEIFCNFDISNENIYRIQINRFKSNMNSDISCNFQL